MGIKNNLFIDRIINWISSIWKSGEVGDNSRLAKGFSTFEEDLDVFIDQLSGCERLST